VTVLRTRQHRRLPLHSTLSGTPLRNQRRSNSLTTLPSREYPPWTFRAKSALARSTPIGRATHGTDVSTCRVEVCQDSDDDVRCDQQSPLEVVASPVDHEIVDDEGRDEQGHRLEQAEVERHVHVDTPAEENNDWSHEEGDLNTAPEGDSNGQVHLVLAGDGDGSDVLGSVTHDGKDNQTNEGLANTGVADEIINAVDEKIGADRNKAGGHQKEHDCRGLREMFRLDLIILGGLYLHGNEMGQWLRRGWWLLNNKALIESVGQGVRTPQARI